MSIKNKYIFRYSPNGVIVRCSERAVPTVPTQYIVALSVMTIHPIHHFETDQPQSNHFLSVLSPAVVDNITRFHENRVHTFHKIYLQTDKHQGSNDTGIGVLGIDQYLPVLGGIGIGPILSSVIVPNTGQTTVYGAVLPPTTI